MTTRRYFTKPSPHSHASRLNPPRLTDQLARGSSPDEAAWPWDSAWPPSENPAIRPSWNYALVWQTWTPRRVSCRSPATFRGAWT